VLRRLHWKALLVIVVVLGLSITALSIRTFDISLFGERFERGSDEVLGLRLGLDLAGGIQLIYQAGDDETQPTADEMEGLVRVITRRVDGLGVTEPSVQQLGDDRLLIQLPGVEDEASAKDLIGRTAKLEIVERICHDIACDPSDPASAEDLPSGLTGADMASAQPGADQITAQPLLLFTLNTSAARRFAEVTQRIYDSNATAAPNQLAFVLDGETLVSAGVRQPILSGSGQISGSFTTEDVRLLAIQVNSGRLPVPVTELSSSLVAPSLGARSLDEAIEAGLVGLALVVFFMMAYYRLSGVVAALSLVFYTALVLAVFKMVPITLTLAGLAGFIMTLGMAVDANILIFERMKEELRTGRAVHFAADIGFNRAWTSIRDGNVSTLLIAAVLFFFGSSAANTAVTGFAVALAIGVAASMFTAILVSKRLLFIILASPLRNHPTLFSPERVVRAERGA
jgi:preprotein translocase subunit SecD